MPKVVIQARKSSVSSVVEWCTSPKIADQLHSWMLNLQSKLHRVNDLKRFVPGLFLAGLEKNPRLKSSLSAMSGQIARPLRAVGTRRVLTIGVDRRSCQCYFRVSFKITYV